MWYSAGSIATLCYGLCTQNRIFKYNIIIPIQTDTKKNINDSDLIFIVNNV
jgi:hypothetical protein